MTSGVGPIPECLVAAQLERAAVQRPPEGEGFAGLGVVEHELVAVGAIRPGLGAIAHAVMAGEAELPVGGEAERHVTPVLVVDLAGVDEQRRALELPLGDAMYVGPAERAAGLRLCRC
jgi:hypothetical protein